MTLLVLYLVAPLAAFVVGLGCVAAARHGGRAWGIFDRSDLRRASHDNVACTGGVGLALASIAVAVVILLFGSARGLFPEEDGFFLPWLALAVAAVAMLTVGVLDDVVSLSGHYKLLALIAAACALCAAEVRIDAIYINTHGAHLGLHPALAWPVTILWICSITVAISFIDGLDGLAGGIAVIAATTIALIAGVASQHDVALVALCLAGGVGAFLYQSGPWRVPTRLHLGDGGSMFLGFMLAAVPLVLNDRPAVGSMRALIVPVIALSIPLLNTAFTLIRRAVLQRRSLFADEDEHVHHRLLAIGLCSQHATALIWAVTFAAVALGWLATAYHGWESLGLMTLLVPLWVGLFRTAGSVRGRDTVAAIRRHRAAGRIGKQYRNAFEDCQLRLRKAGDFAEWWRETCASAQALDFASLHLSSLRRNGERCELRWHHPGICPVTGTRRLGMAVPVDVSADGPDPALSASERFVEVTLNVPQRRKGETAAMKLTGRILVHAVTPGGGDGPPRCEQIVDLESAGRRLTWFNRLLCECGLATLDDEDRTRWARMIRSRDAQKANRAMPQFRRPPGEPRIAIVHDFLYVYGGAERVLEQMLEVFPHADLFSLIDFVPPAERGWLKHKRTTTSFIQKLPLARYKHRAYLPLMPLAVEQLDVSAYDVVLSSSYCVAKGVITRPDQLHVCYCHSPMRFAWDLQQQYLAEAGFAGSYLPHRWLKGTAARLLLHYLRGFDARSANGVDLFLANSDFVGRRIAKAYRRSSTTLYPPVDLGQFEAFSEKQGYYFTSSRLVPYKKIALIVEAFSQTPQRRLVVSGDGPEYERIKRIAGPNVSLVGHQPHEKFVHYMQRARAFVFAAEEDFGIVAVEAMACGTPVITYGRGGTTETVIDGVTGVHFDAQTTDCLLAAVERFEQIETDDGWDSRAISRHADRFGIDRFRSELRDAVLDAWREFQERGVTRDRSITLSPIDAGASQDLTSIKTKNVVATRPGSVARKAPGFGRQQRAC